MSPGVVVGVAHRVESVLGSMEPQALELASQAPAEIQRFDRAVAEVRGDDTRPLQVSLGKIWTVARERPHLARALDSFALGNAAWNLRQTFEEVVRDLGRQSDAWIAARGQAATEECAWFRATVFGSTPRRPGLSRRSPFSWPKNRTRAMSPLAAKTFVRSLLEELILLRLKDRHG